MSVDLNRVDIDALLTPLISVRVALYRPKKPLKLVLRTSAFAEKLGFVGGKVNPGESVMSALVRETFEETGFRIGKFRFIAALPSYRFVELDDDERLMHSVDGGMKVSGLVACEILFAAEAANVLPDGLVEGRKVVELDLENEDKSDSRIRKRHQRLSQVYREWLIDPELSLYPDERKLTDGFERLLRND